MAAKIIKLDEYLEQARMNILNATVSALRDRGHNVGVNEVKMAFEKQVEGLSAKDVHAFDQALIDALDEHDAERVEEIIGINAAKQMEDLFNGISVAEDFNYRRSVASEVARNNAMDWLEENNIEYLIDNTGNFAVKCADRKTHYRVNRQFEHIMNKWDKGTVGKNVDPVAHRKALSYDMKGNLLSDALHEEKLSEAAQDGSMPLPDMSGTPPMFPTGGEGDMTDGAMATFENTEEGAVKVLGDHIGFSSEVYAEKLDEDGGEWLVCDDAAEASFVVDTNAGAFEEIRYVCENVGGRGSGSTYGMGSGASSSFAPKAGGTNVRGMSNIDMPTKFDASGMEVPADPVRDRAGGKINAFIAMKNENPEAFEQAKNGDMDMRVQLLVGAGLMQDSPYAKSAVASEDGFWNVAMKSLNARGIEEAKKKNKAPKSRSPIAQHLRTKGHSIEQDKKKADSKKACRGKVSEGIIGGAMNMTGMQTLGMNRLRKLAELPNASMTVIEIEQTETPVKNEPIVATGKEIRDMDEALDHLNEVFHIYKTLNTDDKQVIRHNLINSIMDNNAALSESVIGLLLDNKPSVLLEFDGEGEHLTEDDKKYLTEIVGDIKTSILEDIQHCDGNVVVPMARIAFLLEALQVQMEDKK